MKTSIAIPPLRLRIGLLVAVAVTWLGGCASAPTLGNAPDPHADQARSAGFVSAAHPLATQAGLDVLRRGGSAIDAAIAVQAMLGLVEPQSSGVAGGAFVLVY